MAEARSGNWSGAPATAGARAGALVGGREATGYTVLSAAHQYREASTGSSSLSNGTGLGVGAPARSAASATRVGPQHPLEDHRADRRVVADTAKFNPYAHDQCVGFGPGGPACYSYWQQQQQHACDRADYDTPLAIASCSGGAVKVKAGSGMHVKF
jgi:hypothetical protein